MIRSGIISDSKQLACLLLSLRSQFKPATQLGLDMLTRLDCLTSLVESLSISPDPSALPSELATRHLSKALDQSMEAAET